MANVQVLEMEGSGCAPLCCHDSRVVGTKDDPGELRATRACSVRSASHSSCHDCPHRGSMMGLDQHRTVSPGFKPQLWDT